MRNSYSRWLCYLCVFSVACMAVLMDGSVSSAVVVNAGGNVWSLNGDSPATHFFPISQASNGNADTWVTQANNPDYFTKYSAPVLMMDLGAEVEINGLDFYNYSTGNSNNASEFSLRFGTAAEGPLGVGNSITYNPTYNPIYGGPAVKDTLAMTQSVTARYVEMTVSDNYRGMPPNKPGGDRVGFSELQFDVTTAPTFAAPLGIARPTATENDSNPTSMHDGATNTQWYSKANTPDYFETNGGKPDPVLVIDMGREQTIGGFDFWNYSIIGNATKEFSLRFADESEGPGSFGTGSITYNPTFTVANSNNTVQQSLSLSENVTARYVEMTLTDNWVEAGAGGDRVGFAEIDFTPVLDPLTYLRIDKPVAVTSSTDASDYYDVDRLIDGDTATTWVTAGGGDYFSKYNSPTLTFDMGKDSQMVGVEFVNYGTPGNGTKDFALAFATDAEGPDGFGLSIDYFPLFNVKPGSALTQHLSFDQVANARYVKMTVLDNYYGWGLAGGDRVGFAEISFLAVPEPSGIVLSIFGALCLVGLLKRRKR